MFEDATFESRGVVATQTRKWIVFALAFNASIVAVLVVMPLIYPEGLPGQILHRTLGITVPSAAPAVVSRPTTTTTVARFNPLIPPTDLTKLSKIDTRPDIATTIAPESVGMPDSVVGGDKAAVSAFQPSPPPVVKQQATPQKIAVSHLEESSLVYKVTPQYPAIAKATHTAGTVSLAATISKMGTIENLRVVSGSPLLQQAALDAVRQWRYRPYLLNGQPVEVETTVQVVFKLGE
ncbi:energy transducer TonB [Acidicapsa dinghuensis]|uniref:Energy transducer TonB n=1 Tax=Acidicapsa dinghuensis TaxID=2218256 RepID=A0ABW1EHN4_9BACT|nr:energy transducer TonB [Acidicapsa dinghuensis]